ncbi:MAG: hypothetical protein BZY80_04420 [SAR202 cluster bacterium Io17-Chloro-G2]|nr:MAG: hypothetical protein BZY80_04420 [SAR202 cluster bacterium Io17-Chloro-G2]
MKNYRDFRFLFTSNFCANTALWFQLLSIGWLVRDLTAASSISSSALLVVTVGGINTLPRLLVGPWGGVLGDRLDRRKIVMACMIIMAVAAFGFSMIIRWGLVEWWHAYIYVLFAGLVTSVSQPLRQTLIANTVPRESFGNAYATNVFTITGTRIIGPFIGGFLIATLGFAWNFTLESALYVAAILFLLPMKTPYSLAREAAKVSVFADLKEGISFIFRGERTILNLIILGIIPNVILHPTWFLLPLFTADVLHLGPDVGGILLAATGVGGFLSGLAIASVGFVFPKGRFALGMVVASSVSVIMFAQSHWLGLAIVVIGLMAFFQASFRTANGTLIQGLTPDVLRGRVTSLQSYNSGFVVLTSLAIGWVVDLTNVTFGIMAVGGAGLALSILAIATLGRVRPLA